MRAYKTVYSVSGSLNIDKAHQWDHAGCLLVRKWYWLLGQSGSTSENYGDSTERSGIFYFMPTRVIRHRPRVNSFLRTTEAGNPAFPVGSPGPPCVNLFNSESAMCIEEPRRAIRNGACIWFIHITGCLPVWKTEDCVEKVLLGLKN